MEDDTSIYDLMGKKTFPYKEKTLEIKKDYRMEKIANKEIFMLKGKDSDFINWNSWHDGAAICTILKISKKKTWKTY